MVRKRIKKFIKNPKKALFILAGPILLAMLVQIMYNIVDTAFVGRLGAESIAALTFCFPLFFILIAINSGIGVGMGSKISRLLGAKREKQAENTAMHGIFISLILAVILFILGIIYLEPLLKLFGASDNVLKLAVGYMKIILFGVFTILPGFVLNQIFVAQGDTKTPMKVQSGALLLNILLDPIFIYALGMGVKGAALATLVSFSLGSIIALYLIIKKSHLKIHLDSFNYSTNILKDILFVGAPASFMMLSISIYIIFINRFMAYFGTNYVAAFGIIARLENFAIMPVIAVSVSLITLVGMFYGAKKYDLLKSTISFAVKISLIFISGVSLIFFLFPSLFLRIFTPDQTIISLGSSYLKIVVFSYPFWAIFSIINRALQGMGTSIPGLITNIVRVFIVAVPLAYLFIFVLGYGYLWVGLAMVLGTVAAATITSTWLKVKLKKLKTAS